MSATQTPFPITLFSFGYKYGPPQDVNLLFDVRFLPNPFHVPELRSRNGTETAIADFVLHNESGSSCLAQLQRTILYYSEQLQRTDKDGLRVGIGCTGGHHRSVAVTEALAKAMSAGISDVNHFHRDIKKESH